ncbi:MAG: hypothetical protein ACP5O4_04070 [bacterium]
MKKIFIYYFVLFISIFIMLIISISFAKMKKEFMWLPLLNGVDKYNLDFFGYYISNDGNFLSGYYIYKRNVLFGVFFNQDQLVKLPTLGGLENCVFGGSRDSLLVGWALDNDGISRPVMWNNNRINKIIDYEGKALSISYNSKYIAGWYYNELKEFKPFIYDLETKQLDTLDNLYFGNYDQAYIFSINDNKNLSGYIKNSGSSDDSTNSTIPFVYIDNKLDIPSGIKAGKFYGMSNNNISVGYIIENDKSNAVTFENKKLKKIFSNNINSKAYSISIDGRVVVGYFEDPNDNNYEKPFVYVNNKVIDLEKEYKQYLEGDSYLVEIRKVSANGEYVLGLGYNSKIKTYQPFVANISSLIK